jgi:molecular chaperone DnaK (HSP70)/tetratricopeptide (TPR) repeat protein
VAERNWAEVALKLNLRREMRNLLIELKDVRNRYSHTTLRGIDIEDQLRDVDTVRRLLQALGAGNSSLSRVNSIHRRLLLEIAQADSSESTLYDIGSSQDEEATTAPQSILASKVSGEANTNPNYVKVDSSNDGHAGKSGAWLVNPTSPGGEVIRALETKTFVGIDFGTSTTVVSVVSLDSKGQMLSRTLPIRQPEEFGGTIVYHLVNTVLAWRDDRLLFGRDAYRLRQEMFEGRNVFSSFKMRLGIDIGPTYPETTLRRNTFSVAIEDAKDATREFFKLLRPGIEQAIDQEKLPADFRLAVSVPASFEANQRRDLLMAMRESGFATEDICLIDEPNAAFLSFVHASARSEVNRELLDLLRVRGAVVLVYDFGAGTCDVSILHVSVGAHGVSSRNLAISRFTALGGDDLDRAIARITLLPQLLASAPGFSPEIRDIDERLLPRLQPTAERLKLSAIEWLTMRSVKNLDEMRAYSNECFTDQSIPVFKIRDHALSLPRPSMSISQLIEAIEPFVSRYDPDVSTQHVFGPVANALEKADLDPKSLDAVLFIGGSALNPIVRDTIMSHLPKSVRSIVPTDLRTHVSLGAALHSFGYHAFGMDLIKPITSESIFVITRGGGLEIVMPAGSQVPSENSFFTRLQINREGQEVVELPVCVGSEAKLLGLLRVHSPLGQKFSIGDNVLIKARITHEKLLDIEATIGEVSARIAVLNPLANRELTAAETRMLEAKQRFNEALLESHGRPSSSVVLDYAEAAQQAGAFDLAAEMFLAAERIDTSENHATSICYCYARAGRTDQSRIWARRAYERNPDAVACYNLSCQVDGKEQEDLLREALRADKNLTCAQIALGRLLLRRRDANGKMLLEKAVQQMEADLQSHLLDKDDCHRLIDVAAELGRPLLADKAVARLESLTEGAVYDEDNLAASLHAQTLISRG